ncbi:hypothetical protein AMTR_s00001p00270080 [Amborella trichopoda]|uniref:Uncharacterized protein n=1 Tax=Amborella trichopoda TaxID=13333 RepID=W1NMQ9_AMBTC|nr:hypothetical protein AMTR_s00001p00270080 [Amborella trichopoda]
MSQVGTLNGKLAAIVAITAEGQGSMGMDMFGKGNQQEEDVPTIQHLFTTMNSCNTSPPHVYVVNNAECAEVCCLQHVTKARETMDVVLPATCDEGKRNHGRCAACNM